MENIDFTNCSNEELLYHRELIENVYCIYIYICDVSNSKCTRLAWGWFTKFKEYRSPTRYSNYFKALSAALNSVVNYINEEYATSEY